MSPEEFDDLRRRVEFLERKMGLYVDDAELDRPKGDPRVNFVPRNWRGPDFKGHFYSKCSPEFLEALADTLTWMAEHPLEGKEKYAAFNRKDAMKARSWARRLRRKAASSPPAKKPAPPAAPPARVVEPPGQAPSHDPTTGEIFEFESQDLSFPENPFDDQEPFQFEESDHV